MPFKSDKQRRYMHAKHPTIAKKWEKEEKVAGYSKKATAKPSLTKSKLRKTGGSGGASATSKAANLRRMKKGK